MYVCNQDECQFCANTKEQEGDLESKVEFERGGAVEEQRAAGAAFRAANAKVRLPDWATTILLHGGRLLRRGVSLRDYSIRNGSTLDVTLTGERLLGGADGPQKRKADANESLRKPFKAPRLNSTSSSSSEPSRNRPLAQSQRSNFGASLGQSASSSTRSPPPENSPASTPTTSSFRKFLNLYHLRCLVLTAA